MEVKLLKPYGFCGGVVRAIDIALKARQENPDKKIYVYGNIVHNDFVKADLKAQEIITVDRQDDLSLLEKGIMITTAHGVSDDVVKKIKSLDFEYIDATCPFVYNSFDAIKEALTSNCDVLYLGFKDHPEAIAATSIDKRIYLFENLEDLKTLDKSRSYLLTNQTTVRFDKLNYYYQYLIDSGYQVVLSNEICNTTTIRQEALKSALKTNYDLVFIVGDPTSNNSNQLYQIALEVNKNSYFITSKDQINSDILKKGSKILITSGASTPNYLVNEVYEYLLDYKKNN